MYIVWCINNKNNILNYIKIQIKCNKYNRTEKVLLRSSISVQLLVTTIYQIDPVITTHYLSKSYASTQKHVRLSRVILSPSKFTHWNLNIKERIFWVLGWKLKEIEEVIW